MLSQHLCLVEFPESPLKCYLLFSWPSLLPSHFLLNFNISTLFPSNWLISSVKTVLQRKHVFYNVYSEDLSGIDSVYRKIFDNFSFKICFCWEYFPPKCLLIIHVIVLILEQLRVIDFKSLLGSRCCISYPLFHWQLIPVITFHLSVPIIP